MDSLVKLGTMYRADENPVAAEGIFRRLCKKHEEHLGKDNPKTILHMQSLADTLCSMNNPSKWKEAKEIYKSCIESTKTLNNGDDSGGLLTVQYINKLAEVLVKEKAYPEAKEHVSECSIHDVNGDNEVDVTFPLYVLTHSKVNIQVRSCT